MDEIARALGLEELGLDRDVTDLRRTAYPYSLMAKLLLEKPDILLLDEPTNYLDEQHIEWLKRYLQDYENAFILISMIFRSEQRHQPNLSYGKLQT